MTAVLKARHRFTFKTSWHELGPWSIFSSKNRTRTWIGTEMGYFWAWSR